MVRDLSIIYLGPQAGYEEVREVISDRQTIVQAPTSLAELLSYLKRAHALIDASLKYSINKSMIDQAENLRIISTASTGVSHIDVESAIQAGIKVRTLSEDKELLKKLTPAAELSWALLIALATRLVEAL